MQERRRKRLFYSTGMDTRGAKGKREAKYLVKKGSGKEENPGGVEEMGHGQEGSRE